MSFISMGWVEAEHRAGPWPKLLHAILAASTAGAPSLPLWVKRSAADHTTTLAGGRPILALDMYEHSCHIDYGARAAAYVDAFMAVINWPSVARAYAELQS